uniref:Uncharacterized protein n=1 Tax=Steinernema glaseri TaxID=37863 RepID=A0A1I7Y069_9BILA
MQFALPTYRPKTPVSNTEFIQFNLLTYLFRSTELFCTFYVTTKLMSTPKTVSALMLLKASQELICSQMVKSPSIRSTPYLQHCQTTYLHNSDIYLHTKNKEPGGHTHIHHNPLYFLAVLRRRLLVDCVDDNNGLLNMLQNVEKPGQFAYLKSA